MRDKIHMEEQRLVDFGNMDNKYFLIGVMNTFNNRFQAAADKCFKEISWKQCFVLNCIQLFKNPPTLKEVSDLIGSSHQNVKQLILKLEKCGYVKMVPDEKDGRKQRIILTNLVEKIDQKYSKMSNNIMNEIFEGIEEEALQTTINTLIHLCSTLEKGECHNEYNGCI